MTGLLQTLSDQSSFESVPFLLHEIRFRPSELHAKEKDQLVTTPKVEKVASHEASHDAELQNNKQEPPSAVSEHPILLKIHLPWERIFRGPERELPLLQPVKI